MKRIHEYKRQLLNVMSIIHRYSEIKAMSPEERKQVLHIDRCTFVVHTAVWTVPAQHKRQPICHRSVLGIERVLDV